MYRKPTHKEQALAWHDLAFQINLHRTITMDQKAAQSVLNRMDAYVSAHAGLDHDANVRAAFWEQIAQDPEVGKKSAGKS